MNSTESPRAAIVTIDGQLICTNCGAVCAAGDQSCRQCRAQFHASHEPAAAVSPSVARDQRRTLGGIGSLLLIVGSILPIITLPIVGSISLLKGGTGDGWATIVAGLVGLLLTQRQRYRPLLVVGLAALLFIGYEYMSTAAILANLERELADNPFAGLVTAGARLEYGWYVLGLGALLQSAAGVVAGPRETRG